MRRIQQQRVGSRRQRPTFPLEGPPLPAVGHVGLFDQNTENKMRVLSETWRAAGHARVMFAV